MNSDIPGLMREVMSAENLAAISRLAGIEIGRVRSVLEIGFPLIMGVLAEQFRRSGETGMIPGESGQGKAGGPVNSEGSYPDSLKTIGGAILVQILNGNQMETIQAGVAQRTGLPPAVVGIILSIATIVTMGYVGKMFPVLYKVGLASMIGELAKMAVQSSPEAVAQARKYISPGDGSEGLPGMVKKVLKK
jgi:hypothetical protein